MHVPKARECSGGHHGAGHGTSAHVPTSNAVAQQIKLALPVGGLRLRICQALLQVWARQKRTNDRRGHANTKVLKNQCLAWGEGKTGEWGGVGTGRPWQRLPGKGRTRHHATPTIHLVLQALIFHLRCLRFGQESLISRSPVDGSDLFWVVSLKAGVAKTEVRATIGVRQGRFVEPWESHREIDTEGGRGGRGGGCGWPGHRHKHTTPRAWIVHPTRTGLLVVG
jgi:hypothetical protein